MILRQTLAVITFELRRSASLPRLAWWVLLAAFPAFIVLLIRAADAIPPDRDAWTFILFTLVPLVLSALALLLWAAPLVQAELEANTWSYLSVRPHGKLAVLLGKYVTALIWTVSAMWLGLTVAIVLARVDSGWEVWQVLSRLVWLSAIAYAAVLTFFGVLVHQRPAVAAVAYGLLFEFVVALVPAVINQVTVQYRLRTLLVLWYDAGPHSPMAAIEAFCGTGPPGKHVAVLLSMSALWLTAAAYLLHRKSLITASDV